MLLYVATVYVYQQLYQQRYQQPVSEDFAVEVQLKEI